MNSGDSSRTPQRCPIGKWETLCQGNDVTWRSGVGDGVNNPLRPGQHLWTLHQRQGLTSQLARKRDSVVAGFPRGKWSELPIGQFPKVGQFEVFQNTINTCVQTKLIRMVGRFGTDIFKTRWAGDRERIEDDILAVLTGLERMQMIFWNWALKEVGQTTSYAEIKQCVGRGDK